MTQVREPAKAGQFYPGSPHVLRQQIESFLSKIHTKSRDVLGCILPHAGYIYSGAVAVSVVQSIKIKDNIILLGPNHYGIGPAFSIMDEGIWKTPLGTVGINAQLACALREKSSLLESDISAHGDEHSLEVEIPIFQFFRQEFKIIPIVIGSNNFKKLQQLGDDIASLIRENNLQKDVLLVASSDMTHYEDAKSAKEKDAQAIKAILELDEKKLMSKINELNISMCGFAPVIVMLAAAKWLGAKKAELVKYQTSGDVTGDNSSVVGYAGITVY